MLKAYLKREKYGIMYGMSPARKPKRKLKKPPALRQLTPEELKEWRIKHDLSQGELATLLGVKQQTVSCWETGARKIPLYLSLLLDYLEKKVLNEQE